MRRFSWWSAVVLLFFASAVSWAFGVASQFTVAATPGSILPGGQAAVITPISGQLTLGDFATASPVEDSHGLALYQGQEIYKVQLGNAALSNHLRLQFLWENPAYSRGILHHGWVEVGLYYPNTTGPFVTNGGTPVALDFSTLTFLNSRQADTILQPNLPDVSTFYVIVRVVNSKFVAPPNQAVTNATLQFYCQVLHA